MNRIADSPPARKAESAKARVIIKIATMIQLRKFDRIRSDMTQPSKTKAEVSGGSEFERTKERRMLPSSGIGKSLLYVS